MPGAQPSVETRSGDVSQAMPDGKLDAMQLGKGSRRAGGHGVAVQGGAEQDTDGPSGRRTDATAESLAGGSEVGLKRERTLRSRSLRVCCFTWNVGNAMPDAAQLSYWLPEGGGAIDLLVVGTQENSYSTDKPRRAAKEKKRGKKAKETK
eukprot:6180057-Pleurochrysis_carterae.AAC.3